MTFNGVSQLIAAALDGFGLALFHEDVVRKHLDGGQLVQVLGERSPFFPATTCTIRLAGTPPQLSGFFSTRFESNRLGIPFHRHAFRLMNLTHDNMRSGDTNCSRGQLLMSPRTAGLSAAKDAIGTAVCFRPLE